MYFSQISTISHLFMTTICLCCTFCVTELKTAQKVVLYINLFQSIPFL